ncbi:MAG: fibronectin type III domain-containing protein [Candidatus Sulfotelmatobacter sp.]
MPSAESEHRVILSWRASAPADPKHAPAVGYCIYRGMKQKDPSPVLLNGTPFPGTSCTDDLVINDKKYYYVVRAISAKGITSIVSNEAPAKIPKQRRPSVSATLAPLCRGSVSLK